MAAPARPPPLDGAAGYRLHPQVALRPEPFGALAYHYGNRRLTFLRSSELAELVRHLEHHVSLDAALTASGVARDRWPSLHTALASLAASEVLCAR
ncbi:MAG: mycofactocin biosynthesis chaperone MftB [Acidimicrobiia bacterium]|nr:mycofactocin biosynthesis chaperone MftB [Acidimicrobiia bacterium]